MKKTFKCIGTLPGSCGDCEGPTLSCLENYNKGFRIKNTCDLIFDDCNDCPDDSICGGVMVHYRNGKKGKKNE